MIFLPFNDYDSNLNYIYMQRLTITVWKIIFLCTCVRVNSMCSKLEGIFKHIGLMPWTHAYVCMEFHGILIPKKLKMIRKILNLAWCNVMPPRWCSKKIGLFDESLDTHPHKPEQVTRRFVVPRGNNACLLTDGR